MVQKKQLQYILQENSTVVLLYTSFVHGLVGYIPKINNNILVKKINTKIIKSEFLIFLRQGRVINKNNLIFFTSTL